MTTAPILIHPDYTKPFILYTDASDRAIGAVLTQEEEDGKHHPINYKSRALRKHEKNYPITEKELLAVYWGVKKNKQYLDIQKFTVATDYSPLKYLHTQEMPDLQR